MDTQRRLGRLTIDSSPTAGTESLWDYAHAVLCLGALTFANPFYSLRFSLAVTGRLPAMLLLPMPKVLQWQGYIPFPWLGMHDSLCKEEKEVVKLWGCK